MITEEIVIPVYQQEGELEVISLVLVNIPSVHSARLLWRGPSPELMHVLKCALSDSTLFPLLLKLLRTSLLARVV